MNTMISSKFRPGHSPSLTVPERFVEHMGHPRESARKSVKRWHIVWRTQPQLEYIHRHLSATSGFSRMASRTFCSIVLQSNSQARQQTFFITRVYIESINHLVHHSLKFLQGVLQLHFCWLCHFSFLNKYRPRSVASCWSRGLWGWKTLWCSRYGPHQCQSTSPSSSLEGCGAWKPGCLPGPSWAHGCRQHRAS